MNPHTTGPGLTATELHARRQVPATYERIWDFLRDIPRLTESGATLRDLYDAMLTVPNVRHDEWLSTEPARLRRLATGWAQSPAFVPIRLCELFESTSVEHTDDYVLAMIGGLSGRSEGVTRAFMLRHDHDLRENVFWRVFEVEGGGEISLANIDKFSRSDDKVNATWQRTVLDLVSDGTLDRTRVLRSCLVSRVGSDFIVVFWDHGVWRTDPLLA